MMPESSQPYSVYNIQIEAPGYEPREISGAEILSGQTALQNTALLPLDEAEHESAELYVIPPHTLYAEYPPKIPRRRDKGCHTDRRNRPEPRGNPPWSAKAVAGYTDYSYNHLSFYVLITIPNNL